MFHLLFLIQRSINPLSIQRKINAMDITFFPIKLSPICPWAAPENPLAYPWQSKKKRCSGYYFLLIKLSPFCLWAAPESLKTKINAVDIIFSWWNCPPSAPELTFITFCLDGLTPRRSHVRRCVRLSRLTFTYGMNWNDNCSFSLTPDRFT